MEIRKKLVDSSKYGTKCPYTMNPEFITVHNTYNDATAENEVAYMIRNDNQVSFHVAVDDKEAVQGLPLERNAWACGDGNGSGNRESISVEICYSLSGGERYYKAEDNATIVVAQLMKQYNIPIHKVRTHQSWSGKYCPHRMLAEGRWTNFIERVQNACNGDGKVTPTLIPPSNNGTGIAYIEGNGINLRKGPGTGYGVIRQLGKGEAYEVWGQSNGWLNLGGDQWIYNDSSYIRYTGGKVPASSKPLNDGVGVVTITTDVLRVRKGPGTNYGIVKKVYQGEKYQTWGYRDGWYNVGGDQWVSGEYVKFEK
ncbi:TPA: N-acetylmuramoyl-L-alanine amidase [Bacillus thuringiensis]|uniref:N-acetylmuramoyl-L-alanine amidase n=2 Tax=Bacillus cereus group TaxID=86661 RepID=A0A643LQZ1_BACTU|nr:MULTISPECIES: N-acetylmuramoyl-L-alanine amidase [Bacillus cereus group]MCU4918737.1 N-acetylmuramoyl-L-alanine amidase [Bacillus cereus]AHZ49090.1 N-acetylmuramoyl-L-alanine amidase [Bacillus thuringiensis serovar kurstaki str. YBT-1520]AIM28435.1 N-acetylmuramoyl-L-alanine amidase [Bacillus thuringiensis serovar kurstaki str. YBT-1520]KAB1348300.1 N-acetylmuramoyl-L-alanine amidase [Bacillus thuringiensis]KAB1348621.1 N-acetylmuramoyl-L-alanine amidase [Bacillus thuringiensis]